SGNLPEHTESEPGGNIPPHPLSNVDARLLDDAEFARRYIAGEIADSFGNFIGKTSPHRTALGPEPPVERKRVDRTGTAHMHPDLLPDLSVPSADSLEHPLNRGFKGAEKPQPSRHPNQTRQELLNVIINDCLYRGYSR